VLWMNMIHILTSLHEYILICVFNKTPNFCDMFYLRICFLIKIQNVIVQWLKFEPIKIKMKNIVTCFISARGNNKHGFSGFNKEVYWNNCGDHTQQILHTLSRLIAHKRVSSNITIVDGALVILSSWSTIHN
jgi:hypothetical protein